MSHNEMVIVLGKVPSWFSC